MAQSLAALNALVVGIDTNHYLKQLSFSKEKCLYLADDFELLSKFIQKKYGFLAYKEPIIVGYSSGATLVYAILAQSPPNTFLGGISMGFCPDLRIPSPLCRGNGLAVKQDGNKAFLLPTSTLQSPWIAFQGNIDQVCNVQNIENYVSQSTNAKMISLPKVGHGFSVEKSWMPQFKEAFASIRKETKSSLIIGNEEIKDLPVIEVSLGKEESDILSIVVSGDGGWAGIDKDLGNSLTEKGLAVVGFNSLQYFWTARTPEEAGKDIDRIVKHYLGKWNKHKIILIGYSLGADVLPFMATRLSPEILTAVSAVVLLNPSHHTSFEFHLTDWMGSNSNKNSYPVGPEVQKLKRTKVLCIYGEEEEDSLCRDLDASFAEIISLSGSHHFNRDYDALAQIILKKIK